MILLNPPPRERLQIGRRNHLMPVLPDHAAGVAGPAFGDIKAQIVQQPAKISGLRDMLSRLWAKPADAVNRRPFAAAPVQFIGRIKMVLKPINHLPDFVGLPVIGKFWKAISQISSNTENAAIAAGCVIPAGRFKSDIHGVSRAVRGPFFAMLGLKQSGPTAQCGSGRWLAGHLGKEKHDRSSFRYTQRLTTIAVKIKPQSQKLAVSRMEKAV